MDRTTRFSIPFLQLKRLALLTAALGFDGSLMAEEAPKSGPGAPLETTASRGVVARDPSTIVRDGDTFWVFYSGTGVKSLHSKDLVT